MGPSSMAWWHMCSKDPPTVPTRAWLAGTNTGFSGPDGTQGKKQGKAKQGKARRGEARGSSNKQGEKKCMPPNTVGFRPVYPSLTAREDWRSYMLLAHRHH